MTEWGKVKGRAERGYVMWAKQVPNPIPLPGAASNPQEAREHATKYAARARCMAAAFALPTWLGRWWMVVVYYGELSPH